MIKAITRRSALTYLAGLALTGSSAAVYGSVIEPGHRLRVKRYSLSPPNWSPGLKLRIAALADFHAGEGYMTMERLHGIIDAANAQKPDLIVLLGDYQTGTFKRPGFIPAREIAEALARLKAPLGVHSVLGNHDWWNDREAIVARPKLPLMGLELERAGIPVFENRAVRLVKDGKPFWLAGLGDQWAFFTRNRGADDLPATLAGITDDAPAILLAHEPDIFPKIPSRISLTLSGHTHGGQVRLLGYSPIVPSAYGNRYAYGHVVEEGRHLIISGGLGTGKLHVRFGVPPEIVVVEMGDTKDIFSILS